MRTFIAIDILEVDKIVHLQNMILKQNKSDKFSMRPIAKGNFHLTLKFLGETDDSEINEITENLRNLKFEPFEIRFTNAGCFPNFSNPRVIWLGLNQQSTEKLNNLYGLISKLLDGISISKHKSQNYLVEQKTDFVPHLTIFRPKPHFKLQKSFIPDLLNVFHVDEVKHVKLKKSVLTPKGSTYTDLLTINAV